MTCDKQKVIDIALAEVGYLEKATNDQLDGKTTNAGSNNYTKYARDLAVYPFYNGKKYGVAWCDVFVDWCFVTAYGKDVALSLTCQPINAANNCGAGCKYSRDYYKNKGQLHDSPQPGDQIFFYSKDKTSISHTGLVYKVDSKKVYTVEGNTSGSSGVVANGGGVFKKSYSLTYTRIAGYGRPKYGEILGIITKEAEDNIDPIPVIPNVTIDSTGNLTSTYPLVDFIKDVQRAFGATVDGIAGSKTLNKTKTISAVYNRKHAVVKYIQKRLYALGYTEVGTADGIAGKKFTSAVKHYQTDNGCVSDGVITRKAKTWRKLLGIE